MKFPKITIAGDLGSGKSTTGKLIAKSNGYRFFSTGDIQREIASNHGMMTLEFNTYMKSHPEIDHEIDQFTIDLKDRNETFVMDSRMAWHFMPNSFKVYLKVQPGVAARRIVNDQIRINERYNDIYTAKLNLIERKQIENERFKKLYNVDCSKLENYDLILDTSHIKPEAAAELISDQFERWNSGKIINRLWTHPKMLIPTQDVFSLGRSNSENTYSSVKQFGYDFYSPVFVLEYDEKLFIYDGHRRVSAAINAQINHIPIKLLASNNDEIIKGLSVANYIKTESKNKFWNSWEDAHGFSFADYYS